MCGVAYSLILGLKWKFQAKADGGKTVEIVQFPPLPHEYTKQNKSHFSSVEPDCILLLIGSSDSLGGRWLLSSPGALCCIVCCNSEKLADILTINS